MDLDYKKDTTDKDTAEEEGTYILNTNTHKFHRPGCDSVSEMKEKNKVVTTDSREDIINDGYEACGICKP